MNKKNFGLMGTIIAAMAVEATPYSMQTTKAVEGLLKDNLVEQNADIRDGDKIATRATEAGIAAYNTQKDAENASSDGASAFEIDDGVPMPTARGGGRTSTQYPFDRLEVGQSFHIAATTDKPNPAKSIASTVSAATKKFATPTGETKKSAKGNDIPVLNYTRKFSVKAVDANDPKGAGARVWRTA
jgi:hypothetical protein